MTNPDEPRSARERDQDAAHQPESESESAQPQDQSGPHPGAQQYPDDAHPTEMYPTQAYGSPGYQNPAYQNPAYQNPAYQDPAYQNPTGQNPDPPAYPPGYNPTQALPPYDPDQHAAANQAYGQTQQFGQTQQYGQPQQYGDTQQFGQPQQYGQPPPYGAAPGAEQQGTAEQEGTGTGSKGPRPWVLALIGLVVLVIVVTFGIAFLSGGSDDSSSVAAAPSTSIRPSTSSAPTTTPQPTETGTTTTPGLIPGGIPEILGQLGSAVGTITANDGSTLTINGLDGAPVTVQTTAQTQIISLSGGDVASLTVGAGVVVQGESVEDGTIRANVIIEAPNFGG